jgi:hypothetical protein
VRFCQRISIYAVKTSVSGKYRKYSLIEFEKGELTFQIITASMVPFENPLLTGYFQNEKITFAFHLSQKERTPDIDFSQFWLSWR